MYLYVAADLTRAGRFAETSLVGTTERHHLELEVPQLEPVADASAELSRSGVEGVVFELSSGLPSERQLRAVLDVLRAGRRVWMYWPAEQAIECVDDERAHSLRSHLAAP